MSFKEFHTYLNLKYLKKKSKNYIIYLLGIMVLV